MLSFSCLLTPRDEQDDGKQETEQRDVPEAANQISHERLSNDTRHSAATPILGGKQMQLGHQPLNNRLTSIASIVAVAGRDRARVWPGGENLPTGGGAAAFSWTDSGDADQRRGSRTTARCCQTRIDVLFPAPCVPFACPWGVVGLCVRHGWDGDPVEQWANAADAMGCAPGWQGMDQGHVDRAGKP